MLKVSGCGVWVERFSVKISKQKNRSSLYNWRWIKGNHLFDETD
jgi:hypothetical protein